MPPRERKRAPEEKEPVSSTGNVPPAQQSINTAQGRAAYHRRSMPCPGTSKDNIPKLPKAQKQNSKGKRKSKKTVISRVKKTRKGGTRWGSDEKKPLTTPRRKDGTVQGKETTHCNQERLTNKKFSNAKYRKTLHRKQARGMPNTARPRLRTK